MGSSGYHEPGIGALGSGIYSPSGPLNYTWEEGSGSRMLTAKIPKVERNLEQKKKTAQPNKYNLNQPIHTEANPEISPLTRSHPVLYENISIYSHSVMTKGKPDDITLCHK